MEKKQKRNVLYYHSTRPDISGLSRKEIFRGVRALSEAVYGNNREDFTVVVTSEVLRCLGPKIFWQVTDKYMLTCQKGRLFGSLNTITIDIVVRVFNLNWIDSFCRRLLRTDKRLWLMVIQGKITNPEQLAKRYSKMYFKGVFSYKALKTFYTSMSRLYGEISLYDIYYYTSNQNLFIERCDNREAPLDLIMDTMRYCRIENTKFNPLWSTKRIKEEHSKQIERDMISEMSKYSNECIVPPFVREGLELIISEREAFLESAKMHNCIHHCYWPQIAKGNYAVVRGNINGEYIDMGIAIDRRTSIVGVTFDQLHTIYNGIASIETRQKCLQWLDVYGAEIAKLYLGMKKPNIDVQPFSWEDLPY